MSKEKKFKITADQLMQLENGFTLPKLQEWFPEVFVPKLEVGKWYKCIEEGFESLACITDLDTCKAFGFSYYGKNDKNTFVNEHQGWTFKTAPNTWVQATEQEVFEALKNEAVKRGFVEGAYVKTVLGTVKKISGNLEFFGGRLRSKFDPDGAHGLIFKNGIWATIIPSKTRKQAEKELNCKIID